MSRLTDGPSTQVNSTYSDLRKDPEYNSYASRLTKMDVEKLYKILQRPAEEIFTKNNLDMIESYRAIKLGEEECYITSWKMKGILCGIKKGKWGQDEVLRDIVDLNFRMSV